MITSLVDVDSVDDVNAWAAEFDVTAKVGGDYDRSVWKAYHVQSGRPQYAVIDRDFVVQLVTRDHDEAEAEAVRLLSE